MSVTGHSYYYGFEYKKKTELPLSEKKREVQNYPYVNIRIFPCVIWSFI